MLENANENLTPRMRNLVAMLWNEWKGLELQIVEMNDEVERIASSDAGMHQAAPDPGGSDCAGRNSDRRFDRQRSGLPEGTERTQPGSDWYRSNILTGGKAKLYGISKRGNCLSAQDPGARGPGSGGSCDRKRDRLAMGTWITALETRAPRNVLIVAMANKLARIAWARSFQAVRTYRAVPSAMAA